MGDADILVVLARVGLRFAARAPASIEQGLCGRHAGRRWGGLGAADTCQRADGQRGLCPRQRANICCCLSHLGGFALHQFVHIFAQFIDVPAQGLEPIASFDKAATHTAEANLRVSAVNSQ